MSADDNRVIAILADEVEVRAQEVQEVQVHDADMPEARKEMPLPNDMRTLTLLGIFVLLLLYTLYFAAAIMLPIVAAFVLNQLLQPAIRAMARAGIPKILAAILMLCLLFGTFGALGYILAGPATSWAAKIPQGLAHIEQELVTLKRFVAEVEATSTKVEQITGNAPTEGQTVTVQGPGLATYLLSGARMVTGVLTTTLLLFFLLMAGDLFLRRLVEILPTLANKKQVVHISHEVERNISAYLSTITLINIGVGIATGVATWLCGLPDPVLWGSLAALLNFVPILGPLVGVGILFVAGVETFPSLWHAALPATVYLAIHLIEGESLTPMLVARRFTLNPVLVILSLLFWYWMWGVPGALLAVPMLGTFKIICDRVDSLMALGHFIGTEPRT